MIELSLTGISKPKILCLGAHCDDIEIGCGGTLLKLGELLENAELSCIVFGSDEVREAETRMALKEMGAKWSAVNIDVYNFRNSYFPYIGAQIKDAFEAYKCTIEPDVIFTHNRNDRHQDHRIISDLTWNTFRNHLILEYEIPKFDGDLGQPNAFFEVSTEHAEMKVDCLQRCFISQREKHWFKSETFKALMRLRSIECNATSGYAEAFYIRKAKMRF